MLQSRRILPLAVLGLLPAALPVHARSQDPAGRPGPRNERVALVARFDLDRDGRLDAAERRQARAWLKENRPQRGAGPRGQGGPGDAAAPRGDQPTPRGSRVRPEDVTRHPDRPLFDPDVVRTVFLEFPQEDWFEELTDFYRTDVALPVTVQVDGVTLPDVGARFRGNSSFFGARGRKKPIDLSFDAVHQDQRLYGHRSLDLLNGHADPSFLREMVHAWIARRYTPAMQAALVRVVINGEDHGIYTAVQQFDRDFLRAEYGTQKGARFKVPADFSGDGGLRWLGDDPAAYRRAYELKGADDAGVWQHLIDLCAVLRQTDDRDLERILPQHLDIDAALWFLALDNALIDGDGYHSRGSDFSLYLDPKGRFHPIPRDSNEILGGGAMGGGRRPGGPGGFPGGGPPGGAVPPDRGPPPGDRPPGPGGPGGGPGRAPAPDQAPLFQADRMDRPLLHRLLSVPAWRARYLACMRTLATEALDWNVLGPRLQQWRDMIDATVRGDVHALYGHEAFRQALADDDAPGRRTLRGVIAARRKAILEDPAVAGPWPAIAAVEHEVVPSADGYALRVTCRSPGNPGVAATVRALLHLDQGRQGVFAAIPMHGDGVFTASADAIAPGTVLRFWVEAIAADGRVACHPPAAGGRPTQLRVPTRPR